MIGVKSMATSGSTASALSEKAFYPTLAVVDMLLKSWSRPRWQQVPDSVEVTEPGKAPDDRDAARLEHLAVTISRSLVAPREREILLQRARAFMVQWVLDRDLAALLGAHGSRSL